MNNKPSKYILVNTIGSSFFQFGKVVPTLRSDFHNARLFIELFLYDNDNEKYFISALTKQQIYSIIYSKSYSIIK